MSAAVALPMAQMRVAPRTLNPWIIALAVVIPTFMEVLDTTIANVALRYIAGGLSAAVTDSEWVLTSYLAANAIVLPLSGFLSTRLGRRRYFLLSIAVFTISSGLCGMATSLGQLILFRVLQGLAGGGLQPSSQSILLDTFPAERQGAAQAVFGVAALIAPVLGPTLGGYITDEYSWRWIFYINLPVGGLAFLFCYLTVRDPDYLVAQREKLRRAGGRFDAAGLGLLAVALVCWEVLLSKGQEWDWLGDPFGRVQTLLSLLLVGAGTLVYREWHHPNPVVNLRPLTERNFRTSCLIIFCAYGVLYGSSTLLPGMLEALFGYDAFHAGLVLSPAGFFSITALVLVSRLLGRGVDARWPMFGGLIMLAAGNFWLSRLNLDVSPGQVVWPRVVLVAGLGFVFAPLNVAAYLYMPLELRAAAVGLLALLRNEGGSVGISLGQTITERREQFHLLRLNEGLDKFNPAVGSYLAQVQPTFQQANGDPVAAQQMAWQSLDNLRQQQASALSYFDAFLIFAILAVGLAFLVWGMKRSVVPRGAHIAAD